MKKFIITVPLFMLALADQVKAHCPLCVAGAAAAVGGATWLNVKEISLGVFLGAFALAMGLWTARLIRRKFISHQDLVLGILVFVLTIAPAVPFMKEVFSTYLSIAGDYGSFLNRTYYIQKFLVGSLLGGLIMFASPHISKRLSLLRRGRSFPFQGIILTFASLLIVGGILQFI